MQRPITWRLEEAVQYYEFISDLFMNQISPDWEAYWAFGIAGML